MVPPEPKCELRIRLKSDPLPERRVRPQPNRYVARVEPLVLVDADDLVVRDLDLSDKVADDDPILDGDHALQWKAGRGQEQRAGQSRDRESCRHRFPTSKHCEVPPAKPRIHTVGKMNL